MFRMIAVRSQTSTPPTFCRRSPHNGPRTEKSGMPADPQPGRNAPSANRNDYTARAALASTKLALCANSARAYRPFALRGSVSSCCRDRAKGPQTRCFWTLASGFSDTCRGLQLVRPVLVKSFNRLAYNEFSVALARRQIAFYGSTDEPSLSQPAARTARSSKSILQSPFTSPRRSSPSGLTHRAGQRRMLST